MGEKVRFLHYPESASVTFSAVKGDVGDVFTYYDCFGGCNDMYEEVFVIDDDGASTVSKFGHRLLRLPTGEIFLDGEEQECK